MPELPEIETTLRTLAGIRGKKVIRVILSRLAPVETTSPAAIRQILREKVLTDLSRRGKYLLIRTDEGNHLVIHLGMSGQLRFYPDSGPDNIKHTHMVLHFEDGSSLHFVDPRRFGTLSLSRNIDFKDNPFLQRLGPSYDSLELKPKDFIARCRRHPKISLKTLTLNQSVASGLGNIYACEALYRAGLDPRKLVAKTTDGELIRLLEGARAALKQGIRYGGVSMRDYLDGQGHRGIMKEFLQVYDREGKKSLDGRGKVVRIVQNARSTWFAPEVQK